MTFPPYIRLLKTYYQPVAVPAYIQNGPQSFVSDVNSPYAVLQTDYVYSYQKPTQPALHRVFHTLCRYRAPCGNLNGSVFS